MKVVRCLLASLALASLPASAAELLYARSDGAWQSAEHPGRYSALNLLDGDPKTVWCSSGSGKGAEIEFVFSDEVRITRVSITSGNQRSEVAFSEFSRPTKIELKERDFIHPWHLRDTPEPQKKKFDPPMETDQVVIKLVAGKRGSSKRHACMADVIFYSGRRALNGPWFKKFIKRSLPHLDFIDTWWSGPAEARNRRLVFSLQGKFLYDYVPNDPTSERVKVTGRYRLSGDVIELGLKRRWIKVRTKRDELGRLEKLKIDASESLPAGMAGVYVRRRSQHLW